MFSRFQAGFFPECAVRTTRICVCISHDRPSKLWYGGSCSVIVVLVHVLVLVLVVMLVVVVVRRVVNSDELSSIHPFVLIPLLLKGRRGGLLVSFAVGGVACLVVIGLSHAPNALKIVSRFVYCFRSSC